MTRCACCNSETIQGPYIGEMFTGKLRIRLFQCWGPMPGSMSRCENTRCLKVEEATPKEVEGEG